LRSRVDCLSDEVSLALQLGMGSLVLQGAGALHARVHVAERRRIFTDDATRGDLSNMSDAKAFKALDADFREGLRTRIKAADIIDRLQNHVMNPLAYPMSQTQMKAALGLLGHVLPQLKAVEHTRAPEKTPTRGELLERIANLQSGAAATSQRRAADGAAPADATAEVRH
jgi:hypothetical protein